MSKPGYMPTVTIFEAFGAGKRIKVMYRMLDHRNEFAYSILNRGWSVGTLFTNRTSAKQMRDNAIKRFRESHPKARLTIIADYTAEYQEMKNYDEGTETAKESC